MPEITSKSKAASKGGGIMFDKPTTLSFQLETVEVTKVKASAKKRRIPFSQWLREAAREKLEREMVHA